MKATNINNWYPFQTWLLSILIFSLLLFLYSIIASGFSDVSFDVFGLFMIASLTLLCTLPSLFVSYILFKVLINKKGSLKIIKPVVAGVTIAGILISIFIIIGIKAFSSEDDYAGWVLLLWYCVSIIISSFLFKLYR